MGLTAITLSRMAIDHADLTRHVTLPLAPLLELQLVMQTRLLIASLFAIDNVMIDLINKD